MAAYLGGRRDGNGKRVEVGKVPSMSARKVPLTTDIPSPLSSNNCKNNTKKKFMKRG